jgi:hypothetical protein
VSVRPPVRGGYSRLTRLVAVVASTVLLAGCAGFGSTLSGHVAKSAPPGVDPHRWAAQLDAASLLASYAPPLGSVRLAMAPKGPWIDKPPSSQATPDVIDLTRLWRTPGTMASVLAWARTHASSHWTVVETGQAGQGAGPHPGTRPRIADVQSRNMTFSLPVRGPALFSRQVLVSDAPSGNDDVTMRVDVQEVWIPTRPTWSFVARAVTSVTATIWTGTYGTTPKSAKSTNRSTVDSLRRLVNAMPVSTVGMTSCPADTGQRFRLIFRGPGIPQVIVSGLTAECGGISLSVSGHVRLGMTDTDRRVLAAIEVLASGK